MHLVALGINHTTAPIALRERVAFPTEAIEAALQALRREFSNVVQEGAILSTCNRTEIYLASETNLQGIQSPVGEWLAQYHRISDDQLAPHLYGLDQGAAVRHAFRVASGLDSMVLGEPQILGQMKQAARDAERAGAMGTFLHQLFQKTFSVAKEVRTRTEIGAHSVSMAATAVRLAQRIFERVSDQRILFVGAGEMIELAAAHFAAQSPASITVANRTMEHGTAVAERFGGTAMTLGEIPAKFAEFDIVVTCTASTLPLIGLGMVERAIRTRKHRPMVIVDLAVPRDVEPEVARLNDVFLYTIDDLGKIVASGAQQRQAAVEKAEVIIDEQVRQFMRWVDTRGAVPLIRELHERAEHVRLAELDRARKMLARGDSVDEVLAALSQGLTNKFLHGPTQLLTNSPEEIRTQLRDLFPMAPVRK